MSRTESVLSTGAVRGYRPDKRIFTALPGEAAAGIVHDLGNLIQIASSALSIAARDPTIRTTSLEPVIAGAKTSLERASALVRRTIRMASERALSDEHVSLADCIAEIEALIRVTWAHSIQLDVHVNADLPAVACDRLALQNAVLNLLFNARDAMPDGGVITIRAEAILMVTGNWIELSIVDRGIGMKPATIDRAFDPFFTTKCEGLGGVGLPMVARFVEGVGGRVSIESEYGVGTTVKLKLPGSVQ